MFENLVGLQVTDEEMYRAYRKAMRPILEEHGGGFAYDFRLADVLINQSGNPMNRVFTIYFPDEATAEQFFADRRYLEAKEKYFNKAVDCITIIAQYER